ncbi:hypothetical protein A8950_0498 [Dongia mobilis]|uniref:Uncharacterized protein n=1 Tax=Dongia mobilis TaxID=578943 RepID=A0A4R6WVA5_9PROT|nr:hypothetical protein A8950_0498 [Dongia mobilis]
MTRSRELKKQAGSRRAPGWPGISFFRAIPAARALRQSQGHHVNLMKEKRQTACKPGSVRGRCRARYSGCPPSLTRVRPLDGHSSGTFVAERLTRPTRGSARKTPARLAPHVPSYLVLLPVGFAVPLPLPVARCALTAPFHPCPARKPGGLLSVALSLGLTPAGRYPAPFFRGARTFLPRRSGSGHPAIWLVLEVGASGTGVNLCRNRVPNCGGCAAKAAARPAGRPGP